MAILSGIFWAYGSTRIRMSEEASTFENVFSFFVFGTIVAAVLAFLPLEGMGDMPGRSEIVDFFPWLLLIAAAVRQRRRAP